MSKQSSSGSMSHSKHRQTGGPKRKNRGRRKPGGATDAMAVFTNGPKPKPPEMFDSVADLFADR